MWYKDWFADEYYLMMYQSRGAGEAEQMIALIERTITPAPKSAILDLACGAGRHSIALALRGYRVTGVDLSERMISLARENAKAAGVEAAFVQEDMRAVQFDVPFDGCVNVFTSFGYFETDAENARVIGNIAAALAPGGWFVIDFFNAQYIRDHFIPFDEKSLNDLHVVQRRRIENGRIVKTIHITKDGAQREFTESVRLFTPVDFLRMTADAGLRIDAMYGSYDGLMFDELHSKRLIMFGRKLGEI